MSKYDKPKTCQLEGCDNKIPIERHGNSNYCCDEHKKIAKALYNELYYLKRAEIGKKLINNERSLKRLAEIYGLEVLINVEFATVLIFDWSVYNDIMHEDGIKIKICGEYGYAIFQDSKMKIYKI